MSAVNELVQRTLAQHGLMPSTSAQAAGFKQRFGAMAAIGEKFAVFKPSFDKSAGYSAPDLGGQAAAQSVRIAEGAEFRQAQFSCDAGSRTYRMYIPSRAGEGVEGVVLMLHGCNQNPEDFANGTGMNGLAEKHRLVVLYPQQSRSDNAQSCWNWFSRTDQQRNLGEPAILAGMTRKAAQEFGVSNERTFVAGLSAGGAMAVILGEAYPDVFAAVGVHSGLPYGAARDVVSAFAAMAGNAPEYVLCTDNEQSTRTIIFHGSADTTVHPYNGECIARQVMARVAKQTLASEEQGLASGRKFKRKVAVTSEGSTELEHWIVEGLGHAWSGGQATGTFTDANGPNASAEMIRFFLDH